jgi:4-hydroxy-3-methylbut-2-enyl diphosphate reductase
VDQVLEYLAERGYGAPIEITTAEEDVQFSLPKELRKDLKSAGQDTSNKVKRS